MQYSNQAFLLLGGNMGDRVGFLQRAIDSLNVSSGRVLTQSRIYETAAWGIENQASFLNQAVLLETNLSAEELLSKILSIELELGRMREIKYGPRIIDIDILLFNDEIIDTPALTVPHPQLANRRFALAPLTDIAAHFIHPVVKKTIRELLELCPDPLPVSLFPQNNNLQPEQ